MNPQLAITRWLAALNSRGEPAVVAEAVNPTVRIDRCGWAGAEVGVTVEVYEGRDAAQKWLYRNPFGCEFTVVEGPELVGGEWVARFQVRYQDFKNYGTWRFIVDDADRILALTHLPSDLPPEWKVGVPEGAEFTYVPDPRLSAPVAHDHGHSHDHGEHHD